MSNKIYYAKPSITVLEQQYMADAVANGWGENCYAYIERFETLFRQWVGSPYAVATSSGTGAMHLGLAALGIGPRDEVILADTNWIASVAPVVHLGATPIFVDILPDSWCIDPSRVEKAISPRTKAIIAVHLYGNLCNMDKLEDIAKRHNLYLIEDAAEALGSRWADRHAGTRGVFGIFSFHGTKTMTTGEGGMLVTANPELAAQVRILNSHGRTPQDRQFCPSMLGYKFKMSNMDAALGCAQLERLPELLARRREIFMRYQQLLGQLPNVSMNAEPENTTNGFWMPTLMLPYVPGIRERILQAFTDNNIDGRIAFSPLSSLPMFTTQTENTHSQALGEQGLNLPCYHDLQKTDIDRVVQCVCGAF